MSTLDDVLIRCVASGELPPASSRWPATLPE